MDISGKNINENLSYNRLIKKVQIKNTVYLKYNHTKIVLLYLNLDCSSNRVSVEDHF